MNPDKKKYWYRLTDSRFIPIEIFPFECEASTELDLWIYTLNVTIKSG